MKPEKTFIFSGKTIRENPRENNFKVFRKSQSLFTSKSVFSSLHAVLQNIKMQAISESSWNLW